MLVSSREVYHPIYLLKDWSLGRQDINIHERHHPGIPYKNVSEPIRLEKLRS